MAIYSCLLYYPVGISKPFVMNSGTSADETFIIVQVPGNSLLSLAKSKNIKKTAKLLATKHNGEVPNSMDALIELHGVGRKTANVLLGQAFGIPGITVDTHIKRVSKRLGFTKQSDAVKIEFDLQKAWPTQYWNDLSTYLILHGRTTCKAHKANCDACVIQNYCKKVLKK
mgnify:CR=1 FL=1